ncbi:MAG: [Fe-Fe] hydrogenase large subunit C-terminal domain-containing protein [Candidatus Aminicenantia bacterium]
MPIVSTIEGKCKRCYSCVRNCPAKAIMVKQGQAYVIAERCIQCGSCIKVCAQGAKEVESHIPRVEKLLSEVKKVIACLAPSFVSAFENIKPGQLVSSLRKLGFSEVWEIAFGAELISKEYRNLFLNMNSYTIISTPCPAIVSYIEIHEPFLLPFLAPIVSPMIALGRAIKKYDPDARAVFIGPCLAKKYEVDDPSVAGVMDAALTFPELLQMFSKKGIDPKNEKESDFDGPTPNIGRSFPISGGLLKTAALNADIMEKDIIVTEGKDRCLDILSQLRKGLLSRKFVDILFCEGCINGPFLEKSESVFVKKDRVINYIKERDNEKTREKNKKDHEFYKDLDLRRSFFDRSKEIPMPSEEEIKEILAQINKTKPEDELNCGACGYNSCREKAIAVYQGIAEAEMCLPYLLQELEKIYIEFGESPDRIIKIYKELESSNLQLQKLVYELEQTQKQLIQAEKLASMGRLAASVAHEINNPLAGVLNYVKLMQRKIEKKTLGKKEMEKFDHYLDVVEREISRCANIVSNLLDFARQREPAFREIDINSVINEAITIISKQIFLKKIKIEKHLKTLPITFADFSQLQQAFINIMINAIEVMREGGVLRIESSFNQDEKIIEVRFSDTGPGIPEENIPKIFEPFFTTKEKGTGLGLSVVYGIITRHKGEIKVSSVLGVGTSFLIRLPIYSVQG